ncbi:hypothetical protein MKEN_01029000 [Mycena kentingensis (nom. inval.)]|nr:hypothetical protein MKEN_01029000 [Mycena kentingensis (nom. inval.)]
MPNLKGVNGHNPQNVPSDEELAESLWKYLRQDFSREDELQALRSDHNYHIGLSSLRNIKIRLGIPTRRTQNLPLEVVTQAVMDEVANDPAQSHGPDYIKTQLRLKNMLVPRDCIRNIMIKHFPDGFDIRFPGKKGRRVARVPLRSLGPYFEISADGHEKLAPAALQMGGVGFSIYGFKDKFSDCILWLKVYPDVRTAGAGAHIFLDFAEQLGYIPIQLTTDKGSEVGWIYAFMAALRAVYAADIDPTRFPFHVLIKSIHNTIIEGFWRHLKEKLGLNLKDFLLRGKHEHLFNPHNPNHEPLFYWIFAPLMQQALDEFCDWWNNHRVRHQHDKIMPSGHIPTQALEYPAMFAALDCRIQVPHKAIESLRAEVTREEGSKSYFQAWPGLTAEFNAYASRIYVDIGEPEMTMATGWDVFVHMAVAMELQ